MITLKQVRKNEEIRSLVKASNGYLRAVGYTEHGFRHAGYVSQTAQNILRELGYDERTVELAGISGWMHDIGNSIIRDSHAISGAIMAYNILKEMGMELEELTTVMGAIGSHDTGGSPISAVSAAVIIADKSDTHRSRVAVSLDDPSFDVHDKVNYAVRKNMLIVDKNKKIVRLAMVMDKSSSLMEYFQLYLERMLMCEESAKFLSCRFELVVNNIIINNVPMEENLEISLNKGEKKVSVAREGE